MQLVNDQKFTLQFHQPQRYCDDFWRIISALEETFQALVGANIYWTPKNTQGLAPHWDAIDAFVLQVRYSHFLGVLFSNNKFLTLTKSGFEILKVTFIPKWLVSRN